MIEELKKISINSVNLYNGIYLFVIGLSKKVLIADNIGVLVDNYFSTASNLDFFNAWASGILFTFQIYFDFSGYTDMAIGLGRMFGVKFPDNFISPLKSLSIIDFWRRWNITLSTFLRDYLYIPLGGNTKGKILQIRNLFITMFIVGPYPPTHIKERFKSKELYSDVLEWKTKLKEMFDVYDYYNLDNMFKESDFYDSVHFKSSVGKYILNNMCKKAYKVN